MESGPSHVGYQVRPSTIRLGKDCVCGDIIAGAGLFTSLTYVATGKNEPAKLEQVVAGVAERLCAGRRCSHQWRNGWNGMYGEDDYDLAGLRSIVAENLKS